MTVRISDHAFDRSRERLGLKPGSVERMAELALEKGIRRSDTAGALRRYVDSFRHDYPGSELVIYGHAVFVFRGGVMATVWGLPNRFNATVRKVKQRTGGTESSARAART